MISATEITFCITLGKFKTKKYVLNKLFAPGLKAANLKRFLYPPFVQNSLNSRI